MISVALVMSAQVSLTLLLIKVAVDVPLYLCIAAVTHPGEMFAGDRRTSLVVKSSDFERHIHITLH